MASAPRDGQRFVAGLWVTPSDDPGTRYFEVHIVRADERGTRIHPDFDRGWDWHDYTHWLPLPLPSAADEVASSEPPRPTSPMERAYGVA